MEVLRATARVRELIEQEDHTKEIPEAIASGHITYGMQSFDQSLMAHLQAGTITYQEALRQSSNPDDFALRVSGISGTSDSSWDGFEGPTAGAQARPSAAPARPAAAQAQPPVPPRRTTGPQPQQAAPAPAQRAAVPVAAKTDELEIERF